MIRAIAFDWGGVFTEGTFDASAVAALAETTGRPKEAIAPAYQALMAQFEVGAFDLPAFHDRFCRHTETDLSLETFETTFLGSVRERTAMFAVLGSIPAEYVVGMLSNNVPALCDRVRTDPRMHRIEHWLFSNEIGVRKPDARAYLALTEALDVPPDETVFIDDAAHNISAARDAGFETIHMTDLASLLSGWRALLPDVPTGIDATA